MLQRNGAKWSFCFASCPLARQNKYLPLDEKNMSVYTKLSRPMMPDNGNNHARKKLESQHPSKTAEDGTDNNSHPLPTELNIILNKY